MRTKSRPVALAIDLPSDVLPTPGGPTRHRTGIGVSSLIFRAFILQGARRRRQNPWKTRRACKIEAATDGALSPTATRDKSSAYHRYHDERDDSWQADCRCLSASKIDGE